MSLRPAPHRTIRTIAYNGQVPGPLLRFQEGRPVTIDVTNQTATAKWFIGMACSCPRQSMVPWKKVLL